MARKVHNVVIAEEGRDKGKHFILTEMPASKAEKWAAKAWLAIASSGLEVPKELIGAGFAGLAIASLNMLTQAKFEQLEPLMDEMMSCITVMPDRSRPEVVRPLVEDDIEEVSTRLKLRAEVFNLHAGPFIAAYQSRLTLLSDQK